MVSKDHSSRNKLTYLVFFFSSLFLVTGLVLAVAAPVSAQVGGTETPTVLATSPVMGTETVVATSPVMGTSTVAATSPVVGTSTVAATSPVMGTSTVAATSPVMGTETVVATSPAVSGTPQAGVPVTGPTSRALINSSDLTGYTVLDRDGNQIGKVNSLILDLRGAAVCAPSTGGAVGTPSASGTSTAGGLPGCRVNNTQTSGVVSYIILDRSGMTGASAGTSATPAPTSAAGAAAPTGQANQIATGGNFVPVPWRFIRINLDRHELIADTTQQALNNAPSFSNASDRPDFFSSTSGWTTSITRFWDTNNRISGGAIPPTGGTGTRQPTLAAPRGSATALVPVTGLDLSQAQNAAAAQQRMVLDIGIVGIGLALLVLGILIRTGKSK